MSTRVITLIAVLVLAVTACTGSDAAEPATTTTTTTTTGGDSNDTTTTVAGSSDSSSTTAPPAADDVIQWQRIDDPSFEGGEISAIIEAGPGIVAVGTDEVPEDAAVWVSTDGSEWERILSDSFLGEKDDQGLEGSQFMSDAVVGPDVIVAVGGYERRAERDLDPGVWLSTDGRTWERIVDEDFEATGAGHLSSVVTWNGSYVAVGMNPGPVGSGERRPAIWTSDDGRDWEPVDGLTLRVDGVITAIARRGSQLVAVGATGHVARPAVWLSDDAVAWDLITSEDSGDSVVGSVEIGDTGELEDLFMTSVAITADGYVAAGGVGVATRAAFWESPDGLFWTLVGTPPDLDRPNMPVNVHSVVATAHGLVAVGIGRLDSTRFPPLSFAEAWVSFDNGISWAQLPRISESLAVAGPTSPWHIGAMHDVISIDGRLLAAGYVPYQDVSLPGPFYHPAVWIGTWE